jgi:hypothetical protein
MSEAKEFFGNEELSKDKCRRLAECPAKSLNWESESVSDHSPGVVENGEILARQIFSPIHIDTDDNTLTPAAFNDVFDKGLSVNRLSHSAENEIHEAGRSKAQKDRDHGKVRQYLGFVDADCSDIRSIVDSHDQKKVFGVFDTALPDAKNHADICLIRDAVDANSGLSKRNLKSERRRLLQEQFGQIRTG